MTRAELAEASEAYISKPESGDANPAVGKAGEIFAAAWMKPRRRLRAADGGKRDGGGRGRRGRRRIGAVGGGGRGDDAFPTRMGAAAQRAKGRIFPPPSGLWFRD